MARILLISNQDVSPVPATGNFKTEACNNFMNDYSLPFTLMTIIRARCYTLYIAGINTFTE